MNGVELKQKVIFDRPETQTVRLIRVKLSYEEITDEALAMSSNFERVLTNTFGSDMFVTCEKFSTLKCAEKSSGFKFRPRKVLTVTYGETVRFIGHLP